MGQVGQQGHTVTAGHVGKMDVNRLLSISSLVPAVSHGCAAQSGPPSGLPFAPDHFDLGFEVNGELAGVGLVEGFDPAQGFVEDA